MSTRQSRSASIPIPRSSSSTSPAHNIESVISIPFTASYTAPPRPRFATAQAIPISHHRSGDDPRASVRGVRNSAPSISPTRPSARSLTHSSPNIPVRSSPRSNGFEPRVIRADSPRSVDPACLPSSSSSLPRTRRASATGPRAPSSHRTLSGPLPPPSPPRPTSFTRPAYLEHSALRHLLQTEAPPSLPPSRKAGPSRRSLTPSSDSEDDSRSPPRRLTPTVNSSPQVLHLPTRWSERYRHELLSVSSDGRDATFQGSRHIHILCPVTYH
jgi:hypothetical protein